MFPLFETLCIKNGKIQNINLHQVRYERSLREYYGKSAVKIFNLFSLIQLPTPLQNQLVRCRIDYNAETTQIQYFEYQRKIYRTFQPVICDDIEYSLKYLDRSLINTLFAQRGACDEIMIIKNGKVTDCSIGNLIFSPRKKMVHARHAIAFRHTTRKIITRRENSRTHNIPRRYCQF